MSVVVTLDLPLSFNGRRRLCFKKCGASLAFYSCLLSHETYECMTVFGLTKDYEQTQQVSTEELFSLLRCPGDIEFVI